MKRVRVAAMILVAGLTVISLASAAAPVISEFQVSASSVPSAMAPGPTGNMFFGEEGASANNLGEVAPDGTVVEHSIPTPNSGIGGIATGPDGGVWYATARTNQLGRYDPSTGTFTEWPLGTNGGGGIVAGSDGNLWVTASTVNKILVFSTSGALVHSYTVPFANAFPHGPSLGPDGNVYFAEMNVNRVGRVTPAGVFKQWVLPQASSKPVVTTPGPDGAIWFTESSINRIGRLSLVGAGTVTTYPLGGANTTPWGITSGADGLVYFTEKTGNKIASINPTTHAFIQYPVPTPGSFPDKIALSPSGGLWFTEHNGDKVGRLQ